MCTILAVPAFRLYGAHKAEYCATKFTVQILSLSILLHHNINRNDIRPCSAIHISAMILLPLGTGTCSKSILVSLLAFNLHQFNFPHFVAFNTQLVKSQDSDSIGDGSV